MRIVYRIDWERDGKTGEAEVLYNPDAPFVPFEDLTYEIITSWIESYIGEEALKNFDTYVSPKLDPGCMGKLTEYEFAG